MNLTLGWGYWLYFLVPLILWFIAASFVRRKSFAAKFLSFFSTGDNRLSLSRLQAFAWTMVIFGAFVAAMAIHTKIPLITSAEVERRQTEAASKEKAQADAKVILDAEKNNVAVNNTPENQAKLASAQKNFDTASKEATDAQAAAKGNTWVEIPAGLLALAGIAIGSGVFSTLISTINNEQKCAGLNSINPISAKDFKKDFPEATETDSDRLFLITGTDLGSTGRVRLGKGRITSIYAPIKAWKPDGTKVVIEMPQNPTFDRLTVDTPNGKLCFELKDPAGAITLGDSIDNFEIADLFRDDTNPNTIDLMKFQMFGWTVIAIGIFSWLFLTNLNPEISSLPVVPESIVLLTGLSQAGYLAGKGVSNIGSKNA